ncbi:glutamine amidotransferase [Rhodococcus sp. Leaf7]|uniref:DJ-1/PfpI family protein n=1 Tax=unclassified Rhodococcus (in: high G+C Gram-positive bacteria) TaxID=192944 RepID=UPI0007021EEB|nr:MULTISPECIES: DJ-1/PfpI family protein [unclassified Rhodococcus (in: high G+C Gram-positive bacteria)]KQU07117.1 glutamine amidotransferase [Rhodococcus sp. Leaf7]KQU42635.1 glutamine amidotransferase [Rhodococcus sp. Leaf247]
MQIAIVLYPGFTSLDVVGPYEVLGRLPGVEVVFVAESPGLVLNDQQSLSIKAVASFDDTTSPDVVVIGGGPGQLDQMKDGPLHQWLRHVDKTTTWTMSVCTGSLILAAAGLLEGRRATTYWLQMDELREYGAIPTQERVIIDGKYLIGAGVSAGIDAALTLASEIVGTEGAQALQLIIEYDPQPPFDSGSEAKASTSVVERAKRQLLGQE